jgi:hypothetical protein
MSSRTHTRAHANRFIRIFTVFLAIFAPSFSVAGPVSDAQAQLDKAYNDYYNAIGQGGKKTLEEQKQLRDKMIDPALQTLNQAVKQESEQAVKDHQSLLGPNAHVGLADTGGVAPATSPPQPAETVDSSDIPRELEFPGKPTKPAITPSPLRSIESYTGPFAPKSH